MLMLSERYYYQGNNNIEATSKGWKDSKNLEKGVEEEEEGLRGQGMP
jgi:hypothetical protein